MRKILFGLVVAICIIFTACDGVTDATTNDDVDMTTEPTVDVENSTDFFADYLRKDRDYLIVVNEDNPFVFDGMYNVDLQSDLVYLVDYDGVARPIEEATQVAFTQMMEDLREEYGVEIGLVSAYRDETEQELVCDGYYTDLPKGKIEFTDSIGPGYSEHHTGLLVLFTIKTEDGWSMDPELAYDSDYAIVWQIMGDYGFIERYPDSKEDVTGVKGNPYEIRFVGSTEIANYIRDENMCLEQFVFFEDNEDNEESDEPNEDE